VVKLSEVITIWEKIHGKDCGELGYCDLEKAVEETVGILGDVPGQSNIFPKSEILFQAGENINTGDIITVGQGGKLWKASAK
jgi:hypothetical protein